VLPYRVLEGVLARQGAELRVIRNKRNVLEGSGLPCNSLRVDGGRDALVASANEDADVHREPPMTVEPECDFFIWIGSSEDIREDIIRFRGDQPSNQWDLQSRKVPGRRKKVHIKGHFRKIPKRK
jgi:hypothetical protein